MMKQGTTHLLNYSMSSVNTGMGCQIACGTCHNIRIDTSRYGLHMETYEWRLYGGSISNGS